MNVVQVVLLPEASRCAAQSPRHAAMDGFQNKEPPDLDNFETIIQLIHSE